MGDQDATPAWIPLALTPLAPAPKPPTPALTEGRTAALSIAHAPGPRICILSIILTFKIPKPGSFLFVVQPFAFAYALVDALCA